VSYELILNYTEYRTKWSRSMLDVFVVPMRTETNAEYMPIEC